jgi:pimeloyl-ACP methyl ester carboxylesterase
MTLLKTDQATINGKSLRYSFEGDPSKPAIVLLHGYPDNLQVWHKLAPKLSSNFYVFSFDWPGMGFSERWSGGGTPLVMAKRLDLILTHIKLEKVHILAQDMGGQAALVFAANYPDKTKSVFVMNSLLMWNEKTSWEIELLRKYKLNQLIIKKLPKIVFKRATGTFLKEKNALSPALKADLWTSFQSKQVRDYIASMCAGYEAQLPKLPDYYKKITCPLTLIWAENGKHFDIKHAYSFKAIQPETKIIQIKGSYHWMALENVDEIVEIIAESTAHSPKNTSS